MNLKFKQLEDYEKLTDTQIKNELLSLQDSLDNLPDEMENDIELQKAIKLVNSRKSVYLAKKRQLKGLISTLQMIARQRGLYAN